MTFTKINVRSLRDKEGLNAGQTADLGMRGKGTKRGQGSVMVLKGNNRKTTQDQDRKLGW